MKGTQRAVFVSDLHLGTNSTLDDFTRDAAFASFLQIPELRPSGNDCVDLVLLGDSFDLWQSVTDEECRQEDCSKIDISYAPATEISRIDALQLKHESWFSALAGYAQRPACRLFFIAGNHDHSIVDKSLQARITKHLGLKQDSPQLVFANYYENPSLALYADHGNQYDKNNSYNDFVRFDWKKECRGYYFVKLFFNRLEYHDPRIENSPGGWDGVWHWLRRILNFELLAMAIRYFWQYINDDRVPLTVAPLRAGKSSSEHALVEHPNAPMVLVSGGLARTKDRFFSVDQQMEEFFREAYDKSEDVRLAVNEILAAQESKHPSTKRGPVQRVTQGVGSQKRPEVPKPKGARRTAVEEQRFAGPPKDAIWAESLYENKPFFRNQLNRDTFEYVIFGHTHGALEQRLSNGALYLNTGTWTTEESGLPIVIAESALGGGPIARLRRF